MSSFEKYVVEPAKKQLLRKKAAEADAARSRAASDRLKITKSDVNAEAIKRLNAEADAVKHGVVTGDASSSTPGSSWFRNLSMPSIIPTNWLTKKSQQEVTEAVGAAEVTMAEANVPRTVIDSVMDFVSKISLKSVHLDSVSDKITAALKTLPTTPFFSDLSPNHKMVVTGVVVACISTVVFTKKGRGLVNRVKNKFTRRNNHRPQNEDDHRHHHHSRRRQSSSHSPTSHHHRRKSGGRRSRRARRCKGGI